MVTTRMSGLWGSQTALDLYLQEHGITTLFFAGVNADQVRLRVVLIARLQRLII
jgi:nicotinamidase-related amidase